MRLQSSTFLGSYTLGPVEGAYYVPICGAGRYGARYYLTYVARTAVPEVDTQGLRGISCLKRYL